MLKYVLQAISVMLFIFILAAQSIAGGVEVEYLKGKSFQKEGYLEFKEYKSKITLPEVIWSSEENIFEDQDMARELTKRIMDSDKVHPVLKRIHQIMKPRI